MTYIKPEVVEIINKGQIHILEPTLDTFVKSAVQFRNLKVSLQPYNAYTFIITLPTRVDEKINPDITYVIEPTNSIAPFIRERNCLILESTSPIDTNEKLIGSLRAGRTHKTRIIEDLSRLMDEPDYYLSLSKAHNPYGDGNVVMRIIEHIQMTL